jgi:hypothetical protein
VLRIREVYPGSEFFPSRIPDPNFSIPDPGSEFFPSRIPDPHQRIKAFSPPKIVSKLSEICSGLIIPDPDPDFLPIPDPGVQKAPDTGSWTRIRNTAETLNGWSSNFVGSESCQIPNVKLPLQNIAPTGLSSQHPRPLSATHYLLNCTLTKAVSETLNR